MCFFNIFFLGATLVLACRTVEKGLEAKKYILSHFKNKSVKIFVKELDLCKISSIAKFTCDLKAEFSEIYALVNNAGVFYHPQGLTEDGFEITLQTNYLGIYKFLNIYRARHRKRKD